MSTLVKTLLGILFIAPSRKCLVQPKKFLAFFIMLFLFSFLPFILFYFLLSKILVKNPPAMQKTPVSSLCVQTNTIINMVGFRCIILLFAQFVPFSITLSLSFQIFLYLLVIYLNVSTDFELYLFVVFLVFFQQVALGVSNPLLPQLACILHPHVLTTPSDSGYVFASGNNI